MANLPERFLDKISPEPNTGCWLWTASTNNKGYGVMTVCDGRKHLVLAHRFAFEVVIGPIPEGLELDHLCHVRDCVNPAHLLPTSHRGNMRNSLAAIKSFCKHGHERTPDNTYIRPDRNTKQCKVCNALKNRAALHQGKENPDGEGRTIRLS